MRLEIYIKARFFLPFAIAMLFSTVAAADVQVYSFPEIESAFKLGAGYRFTDASGSNRAGEYDYLHDSAYAEAEVVAFPFPHRVHLELEFRNREDTFGDLSYAYRDLVLTRWVRRAIFHNLDNTSLVDLVDSGPGDPLTVGRRDIGEEYGVASDINNVFLRFKAPKYPFHLYLNANYVKKEGSVQQRFLGGSGWFNEIKRITEQRDIDYDATDITVGANSHLGPVEVDYSHSEKRLNAGGDALPSENYSGAGTPPGSLRTAGLYPHNLTPELEGSTDTVKLHTSYTGKIVASATFSRMNRENTSSKAETDYFTGAGDLKWTPYTFLSFSFKYRYRDTEADNPDTLPANYLGFASYTSPLTGIKRSISSEVDTYSANAKYRVSKSAIMNLGYLLKETSREGNEPWGLPGKTRVNVFSLSGKTRIAHRLKLRGAYEHAEIENPAYNTQPEKSDSGRFSLTWSASPKLQTFLSYKLAFEERDSVTFTSATSLNRVARKDKLRGSVTYMLAKGLTLSGSYAFIHNHVVQDIFFGTSLQKDIEYDDISNIYAASFHYAFKERVDLDAAARHTRSSGDFSPDPLSIASLSKLKIRETEYTFSGRYSFSGGWGAGVELKHTDFENLNENPDNPELFDGSTYSVILLASRKW